MQSRIIFLVIILSGLYVQQSLAESYSGHVKYGFNYTAIPEHSLLYPVTGDQQSLNSLQLRLAAEKKSRSMSAEIHYEAFAQRSTNPDLVFVDRDRYRAMDLASVIEGQDNFLLEHRLDRFNLAYMTDDLVLRLGRQAVSWGNGFVFHVMDVFNPFDPVAIDKDYKTGDDMLYGQWSIDSSRDLQLIALPRRNDAGHLDDEQGSLALKFHAMETAGDFDLLLARHYDQSLVALGYAGSVLESVFRFDLLATDTLSGEHVTSYLSNIDYSWVMLDYNIYAFVEYFHNGFGQDELTPVVDAELVQRLARGELFSYMQDYLALGLTVELHPLLKLSPVFIVNLHDHGRLVPVTLEYNWKQNLVLKTSLILSAGDTASEFAGVSSSGDQFKLLLSWYF